MKRWFFVCLCLFLTSSAWANAVAEEPTVETGTVTDQENGFSIHCPPGWESLGLSPEKPYNKAVLVQQRNEENPTVFYVQVFDSKGRSLRAYRHSLRHVIVTQIGGRVLEDKPVTVAGVPARRLVYTGNANNPEDLDYRFSRTLMVHKGKLYVLHGVTNRQDYIWARPEFESLAATFRLLDDTVEIPIVEENDGDLPDVDVIKEKEASAPEEPGTEPPPSQEDEG